MSWDPFLMKILFKKEVCGSHKQYTGPTRKASNTLLKKKRLNVDKRAQTLPISSVPKRVLSVSLADFNSVVMQESCRS